MTPHYELKVHPARKLIEEKIVGMWDVPMAHQYIKDFKDRARPLLGAPWALLTDLTDWKTSIPEIVELIGNQLGWQMENNMKANANIIPNPSQRLQFKRMVKEGGVEDVCFVFATREDADAFLKEKGF